MEGICMYVCMCKMCVCKKKTWVDLTCAHIGHLLSGEHGEGYLGDGPGQL